MEKVIIRKAHIKDTKALLSALKDIAKTSKWLVTEPDEIPSTSKEEEKFIRKHIYDEEALMIVAESRGKIIGTLHAFGQKKRRMRHVVEIGVSVAKRWRKKGIGTSLMNFFFEWAKHNNIKKVKLSVATKNIAAVHLYKKFDFVTEGIFEKELKIGQRFYDIITMAKFV